MQLPPGEMLLLTIDRDVERMCGDCEGHGRIRWREQDGTEEGYEGDCECPACHRTGKRTVHVRGWCEIEYEHDAYGGDYFRVQGTEICESCERDEYLRHVIIAAWRDGTLPEGVAEIREVDE